MRKHWVFFILIGMTAWAWGGNRADINADQSVNSADMTVLANLLTGNLDIAGYDLANVVVVAPQGGDFTNPRDAAIWVAAQSPSASNRFLIWVAPGEYSSSSIYLPSYTTLKGSDRRNCRLSLPNVVAINCDNATDVTIADLQIYSRACVDVRTCTSVLLRNVHLESYYNSGTFDSRCANVLDSSEVTFEDCSLTSTGGPNSTLSAYLVFNGDSDITLKGCTGVVSHERTIELAIALYMDDPGDAVDPEFRVENCRLTATAATAGYAYYLRKDTPALGWTRLFNCILLGTNNTTTQLVRWNCCDPDGVAIP
jgi:hypothetical protein